MYASDNNRYPSGFAGGMAAGQEFQTWADVLTPYNPLYWTNIAWHCPSYTANKGVVAYEKPPPGGGKFVCWTSYAYNGFGIVDRSGHRHLTNDALHLGLGVFTRTAAHEQQIASPSEMYAVGDSRPFLNAPDGLVGGQLMDPYKLFGGIGVGKEAPPPHSDGYNISFVDGHVDLVKRKDYLFPPRTAHNWNRDNQPHPEFWAPTNMWVVQN